MSADETYIGAYENDQSRLDRNIIVTSIGVYIGGGDAFRHVRYSEMVSVASVGEKHSSDRLTIRLEGGETVEMLVAGGVGRFRDVHQFCRFLDRVVADRRSPRPPT